jgi:hypothetical protein
LTVLRESPARAPAPTAPTAPASNGLPFDLRLGAAPFDASMAPPRSPPLSTAAAARLRSHALSVGIVFALLAVVAWALGTGTRHFPAFADDEGTYVAQAWALLSHGSLGHYTYWYDHPPFAWIQLAFLSALFSPLVGGGGAVPDGRVLMLVPALVSAGLLYMLARRLGLRRGFAAGALVLFALSPLAVSSLRMVYLDNFATPWVLGAFVLAASPRRNLWAYAGSAACFVAAVLSKETSVLVLPALVLQILQGVDRRTRAFCLAAFGSVAVLVVMVYPLYALLKGELLPGRGHVSLLEAARFQLYGRPATGSVLSGGSLSRQLVDSWLQIDPWLLGAGIALAIPALLIRRLRAVSFALLFLTGMTMRPGYLPQPYVIALLPFCGLVIAGVADALWAKGPRVGRVALGSAAVAGILAVALAVVAPRWRQSDSFAMAADQTSPVEAAQHWIARNIDHRARVLVDDTLYVDLVQAGFRPQYGVVWFYKLDFTTNLDPSVARRLPGGWRSFDYVVSTRVIRAALAQSRTGLTQVRQSLRNSRVVATFGTRADRVEVRRITGIGTGSGFLPRPKPKAPPAGSARQQTQRRPAQRRPAHRRPVHHRARRAKR